VDKVEGCRGVSPGVTEVVDFELYVWGYVGGLCRGEVIADDRGGGVAVAHVDNPDTRTHTDVENAVRVGGYRGEVQGAVKGQEEQVVVYVHLVG
jgi:hypothetical protein